LLPHSPLFVTVRPIRANASATGSSIGPMTWPRLGTVPYAIVAMCAACLLVRLPRVPAQESTGNLYSKPTNNSAPTLVVGRPFSATKYAWQVKLLPDGKSQFIRNERYPTRIARDAKGRVMMQMIDSDQLMPECDHMDRLLPPV
jgi:hypothetical protein